MSDRPQTPNSEKSYGSSEISRRRFEHLTVLLIPLVYGAAAIATVVRYLMPYGKRRLPSLDVGPTTDFAGEGVKLFTFNDDDVFVLTTSEGIQAFKSKCPHLGCAISWGGENSKFGCPCHGMQWNRDGKYITGPENMDIVPQSFEIKDGHVILMDEPASEA